MLLALPEQRFGELAENLRRGLLRNLMPEAATFRPLGISTRWPDRPG